MERRERTSVYDASTFEGSSGGERIQTALDAATDDADRPVVEVVGDGPDGGVWETEGLRIGSGTALVIRNATIRLAPGADDNVVRNRDFEGGDDGISIIGVGDATIDGNAPAQTRTTEDHGYQDKDPKHVGLRFEHCTDLTVEGVRIERTAAWGLKCEAVSDATIEDLHFEQGDTYINQDGIHLVGPAQRVTVRHLTGTTWDDAVAINVGGAVDAYGPTHGGGDIEHVSVSDLNVAGHRAVRLFSGDGHVLRNVEVANVVARNPVTHNAVEVNATYADVLPTNEDVRDVRLRNIHGERCDQVVHIDSPATALRIDGVSARNVSDGAVRISRDLGDVTITGIEHRSDPTDRSQPPEHDEGRTTYPGTATVRLTERVSEGRVRIRDVLASEDGTSRERENVVIAVENNASRNEGNDRSRALELDLADLTVRGAASVLELGAATGSLRALNVEDVSTIYGSVEGLHSISGPVPSLDVRRLSAATEGAQAFHDGSGGIRAGPVYHDGDGWISTVSGCSIQ